MAKVLALECSRCGMAVEDDERVPGSGGAKCIRCGRIHCPYCVAVQVGQGFASVVRNSGFNRPGLVCSYCVDREA